MNIQVFSKHSARFNELLNTENLDLLIWNNEKNEPTEIWLLNNKEVNYERYENYKFF
jgi:hypothetical protein